MGINIDLKYIDFSFIEGYILELIIIYGKVDQINVLYCKLDPSEHASITKPVQITTTEIQW